MYKQNARLFKSKVKYKPLYLSLAMFPLLVPTFCSANSVSVDMGSQQQQVSDKEKVVTLNPFGTSLSLSFDITAQWNFDIDYQQLNDEIIRKEDFDVDLERKSWNAGLSYYMDSWSFTAGMGQSRNESIILKGPMNNDRIAELTELNTLLGSVGYNWIKGYWFYSLAFGTQVSFWDITSDAPPPNDEQPHKIKVSSDGDSTSFSSSASIARYWSVTDSTAIIVGSVLSWSYVVSGDSAQSTQNGLHPPPPPPRPGGGQPHPQSGQFQSVSGDDNYGQASLYISYNIDDKWSIDFDISTDIASAYNSRQWSAGLNYIF